MGLTIKEKNRINLIIKKLASMVPFVFLIVASIMFVSSYGKSNDFIMKIIKECLLIFNVFAGYSLVNKILDLILEFKKN